ncbi:hypothetical protein DRN74_01695 [Candidatus Micrarchaeota archaeon]|nr:MAG: hypothetical protein DRN74_01695 [Candidatus Micrarchaeota archaeon]
MNRAFVISSSVFILLLASLFLINFIMLTSTYQSSADERKLMLDSLYNVLTDAKRLLFYAGENVLDDAVADHIGHCPKDAILEAWVDNALQNSIAEMNSFLRDKNIRLSLSYDGPFVSKTGLCSYKVSLTNVKITAVKQMGDITEAKLSHSLPDINRNYP